MTARWLLDHNPDPTEDEIREAISGQLCRCTGYENIVRAVRWAAEHPEHAPSGARHDTRRRAGDRRTVDATDAAAHARGRQPDRLRPHAAQGGRPVPARPGQLRRRRRSCPACCTARSCAARTRTPGSCRSTRPRPRRTRRCEAVITGAILETLGLAWMPTLSHDIQAVLATDKVRFQGQEVAFVVAEDHYSARDALELIDVEYEPLPRSIDAKQALDPERPGDPRRHGGQDRQPHLRLGGRRRGADRRRSSPRADVVVDAGHALPAVAPGADGDLRHRRRHGPGHRQAHALVATRRRRTPTARCTRSSPACPSTRSR